MLPLLSAFVLLALSSLRCLTLAASLVVPTTPTDAAAAAESALSTTSSKTYKTTRIEDAQCSMEDVERANDSQLHSILQDLKQTAFFRSFVVDLEHKCPLQSWNSHGKTSTVGPPADPTKDTVTQSLTQSSPATAPSQQQTVNLFDFSQPPSPPEEEEEEFQCTGGAAAEELDEDAEPLCHVQGGGGGADGDDFLQSFLSSSSSPSTKSSKQQQQQQPKHGAAATDPPQPQSSLDSNALLSLSKDGFASKSQEETFAWNQHSDRVTAASTSSSSSETSSSSPSKKVPETLSYYKTATEDDCHDNMLVLPDSQFWMDICSNIHQGETSNVVNLVLNPERNTGYNGTHIWKAIYEENCVVPMTTSTTNVFASKEDDHEQQQCLEQRVLYRLLSGLHTSTTLSIAMHYYPPSKRKNRTNWEPNPTYFMQKFQTHPDHLRNLHFSYVVLLRALHKAAPTLYQYKIQTGNAMEDETATLLLRRLLDSAILQSCHSVFSAFDESAMFQQTHQDEVQSIRQNFKGVFHNVSSILDCVQCQQCKLHGKLTMLGYGTALKILFAPPQQLESMQLERNEVVAFVNTVAKMSESMHHVKELTRLYWEQLEQQDDEDDDDDEDGRKMSSNTWVTPPKNAASPVSVDDNDGSSTMSWPIRLVDQTVGLIAQLASDNRITPQQERFLVEAALQRQDSLMILAKHYGKQQVDKFVAFATQLVVNDASAAVTATQQRLPPDAIVVGSGLAGLAATLNLLDRGGRVVLIEKEHRIGGNSNKASSGINACCPSQDANETQHVDDSVEIFRQDTTRSAGAAARPELIDTLVSNSQKAVEWLQTRAGVDLSLLAQLGGHSAARTHRPNNGMAGAEIIFAMQKAVKQYEALGQVQILLDTQVTRLLTSDEEEQRVIGVEYVPTNAGKDATAAATVELFAPNVVLATGGFASDRSAGSFLERYRPELLNMPTTAGSFSTGDGITLATQLGAGITDMEHVQIHPTGWVDPTDPTNPTKTLAAELMRGVGGVLINSEGKRFCNELGTRAYVTDKMLSHNAYYAKTGQWKAGSTEPVPSFSLVLSSSAAAAGNKHVRLYTHKGLMTEIQGVQELAKWMNVSQAALTTTLKQYQQASRVGKDEFGKTVFKGVFDTTDLNKEVFYVGRVTPVLHYCMGGLTIDTQGRILKASDNGEYKIIPGLYGAGEVTGGVHGVNRLGGNSLLECTVFGTIVGQNLPIQQQQQLSSTKEPAAATGKEQQSQTQLRQISLSELQQHDTPEDCWVAIHGIVYDLTDFAQEHPAGPESIYELAGQDGTAAFDAVHNRGILDDFDDVQMGQLVAVASGGEGDRTDEVNNETVENNNRQPTPPGASPPVASRVASAARSIMHS